ncbi:MAG TPA: sensor histidine kinase [Dyella sp.]|uniref:sensor histidine kinase n=1 Tax=Dyella sp. TaxID=1869338 RepID=UPI002F94A5BC
MNLEPLRHWLKPAIDSPMAENIRHGKSPWTDMVHLLWSAWIFVTPLFGGGYGWSWAAFTAASYPVFIVLYLHYMVATRRAGQWYALAAVALGLVLLPWYPSSTTYFVFGCILVRCRGVSIVNYMLRVVALNACYMAVAAAAGFPWQMIVTMPLVTFIVTTIVNVESMSEEQNVRLRLSHDEVRRLAATAERERIGRDLHDLLGHTLSLITLKLELSRKLFDRDPEAARREMADAERVARHALAEVRSAVTGIRATDIAAELASVRLLLESSHVHMDYVLPALVLPVDMERSLALILREAATNIARHAQASRATVKLETGERHLHVTISDNGRGGVCSDGNGLCGMRERVLALGGQLEIQSPKGQGTILKIVIPLPEKRLFELPDEELAGNAEDTSLPIHQSRGFA